MGVRLGKKKHIADQAGHSLSFGGNGGKEVLFFFGRSFFYGGDGGKNDGQGRTKLVGGRRYELYLFFPVLLDGGKQFFRKEEGKEGEQKNSRQIDQRKVDALVFDFGVQLLQRIQDKNFRMLFFPADPGDTGIIVLSGGCGKWKLGMINHIFLGRICIFDGKRRGEVIQGFFFRIQAVLAVFSLAKEQGNPVVCDSYKIGIIGFHAGKPFVGDYVLLFEVIDKVIHRMLERKELALCQSAFGDIEIDQRHNKQYGGGGPGA